MPLWWWKTFTVISSLYPNKSLKDIIPAAVDEVGGPTILATLTVIAALLPMAFVSGLMGPYMSPIPINASLGMALSLSIAFTVTPWLALKWMKSHHGSAGHDAAHATQHAAATGFAARLPESVRSHLAPLLEQQPSTLEALGRHRGCAMFLSVGFAGMQWVIMKMLPFDNKSEFQVVVDMPAWHAFGEHRCGIARHGHLFVAANRSVAMCKPTPARPAPSPSMAWCASTICAPMPSKVTCKSI
jgi:multidrug efflux pump subunit AcrB